MMTLPNINWELRPCVCFQCCFYSGPLRFMYKHPQPLILLTHIQKKVGANISTTTTTKFDPTEAFLWENGPFFVWGKYFSNHRLRQVWWIAFVKEKMMLPWIENNKLQRSWVIDGMVWGWGMMKACMSGGNLAPMMSFLRKNGLGNYLF